VNIPFFQSWWVFSWGGRTRDVERSARGRRHIFFTIFRPKIFPKKKKMSYFEELSVGLLVFSGTVTLFLLIFD
jgi:hypothetical protein